MSVLVVGTVAYDTITTPNTTKKNILGGSGTFFSIACSKFSKVSLIAVVGKNFNQNDTNILHENKIDLSGFKTIQGETFKWSGEYYGEDLKERKTIETQLNVLSNFNPILSEKHKKSKYLFLANMSPETQLDVLNQFDNRPNLVVMDTMNFWIENNYLSLIKMINQTDVLLVDSGESQQITGEKDIKDAGKKLLQLGPSIAIIKQGGLGSTMFHKEFTFSIPAYPVSKIVDPTGAGDSFAGGFLGYISRSDSNYSEDVLKKALKAGTILGSFAVEYFSVSKLTNINLDEINSRIKNL